MMGCFTGLRSKKKKSPLVASKKHAYARETSLRLPEPEAHVPSLQSAPPSFRNRAKICQSANKVSHSRARVLSAPSSLILVDQDGLPYAEFDDQDDSRGKGGALKAHRYSNPLPLPLPSPEGNSLRNFGSFKAINASGPLETSGPLPLPPKRCDGLKNFSYDEISSACQCFSGVQCVSETLTSTSYKASFRDDFVVPKMTEAIVARLLPSNQVLLNVKFNVIFSLPILDVSLQGCKNFSHEDCRHNFARLNCLPIHFLAPLLIVLFLCDELEKFAYPLNEYNIILLYTFCFKAELRLEWHAVYI
jgi:hypothetical protein